MPRWNSSAPPPDELADEVLAASPHALDGAAHGVGAQRAQVHGLAQAQPGVRAPHRLEAAADARGAAGARRRSRPRGARAWGLRVTDARLRFKPAARRRASAPSPPPGRARRRGARTPRATASRRAAARRCRRRSSAASTASRGAAAWSALRSVLRRWPNAACTTRPRCPSSATATRGAARASSRTTADSTRGGGRNARGRHAAHEGHVEVLRQHDRQPAVAVAVGRRDEALGHLALQHDHRARDEAVRAPRAVRGSGSRSGTAGCRPRAAVAARRRASAARSKRSASPATSRAAAPCELGAEQRVQVAGRARARSTCPVRHEPRTGGA